MLLLKRRGKIEKVALHSDISSTFKSNCCYRVYISSFTSLLFAKILLQMNHSCVFSNPFILVFLFHEIMFSKYQNVLIFTLRYLMK